MPSPNSNGLDIEWVEGCSQEGVDFKAPPPPSSVGFLMIGMRQPEQNPEIIWTPAPMMPMPVTPRTDS